MTCFMELLVCFLAYISLLMLLSIENSYKHTFEKFFLCLFVFSIYVGITVISHSYIENPFMDYFINIDQIGFYSSSYTLANFSITDIFNKSFTEYHYSDSPLSYAYFATLIKLSRYLGIGDYLFFLKLNTAFITSLIPGVIYRIVRLKLHNESIWKSIVVFSIISPFFLYSCQLMRDVHVALLYSTLCFLAVKQAQICRYILLLALIIITCCLRLESGLFAIAFVLLALALKFYNTNFFGKFCVVCIILLIMISSYSDVLAIMNKTLDSYLERSVDFASNDSLGVKLNLLPFPISVLAKTIFAMLLPFPIWHPFQEDHSYSYLRIFECPFPIYWCVILLSLIHIIWTKWKILDNEFKYLLFLSLIYLALVSASEFNVRRLMAFYPIIFSVFLICKHKYKIPIVAYTGLVIFSLTLLHIIYLNIK